MSPISLTRFLTERNTVKLVKDILGGHVVEPVLQRLDRLSQEEARNSPAQTLEVIYCLVRVMTVVMNGGQTHSSCRLLSPERNFA